MYKNESPQAFEMLKEYLIQNHNAKIVSGGREVLKRCHICGDSRDISNAHMYIGYKDGTIFYNCFKCNASGIVDGKFLRNLGCYDHNIINSCNDQNKKPDGSGFTKSGSLRNPFLKHKPIIPLFNDEFSIKKLKYIEKRIGYKFDSLTAARFKIILNAKQFIDANNISYTRNEKLMDLIDKFFVGFLSVDNSMMVLRRLIPEGKLPEYIDHRYINYNIFGNTNSTKYYIIPNNVNIYYPLNIHIAEGGFDILSIYTNVSPLGDNGVFLAAGGKRYLDAIKYIVESYGFIGFSLHLYPDADIDNYKMNEIANYIAPFNSNIYIHRNIYEGEKDFGVPINRIKDSITKL